MKENQKCFLKINSTIKNINSPQITRVLLCKMFYLCVCVCVCVYVKIVFDPDVKC